MGLRRGSVIAMTLVLALVLAGCKHPDEEEAGENEVATVEPIQGSDVSRVTLSEAAADRLAIETVPVESSGHGEKGQTTIPYAAVLYDPAGGTWTYTNPEPLVFVRAAIKVMRIDGGQAVLSAGPSPGTEVVTAGAAELLGTEYEVGEE